jgi:hypothetical protein
MLYWMVISGEEKAMLPDLEKEHQATSNRPQYGYSLAEKA